MTNASDSVAQDMIRAFIAVLARGDRGMIDQFIEAVESLYPEHKWLARSCEGAHDVEQFGPDARYMVHIYRSNEAGDMVESYLSAGSKLDYAFRGALALAAKRAPADA